MSDYYYSSSDESGEVPDYHGYVANQKLEKKRKQERTRIRQKKEYDRTHKRDYNTVTQGLIDGRFFIGSKPIGPTIYCYRTIVRDTETREELYFNLQESDLLKIRSEFLVKKKK
jgi:hypothetical protein